MRCHAKAASGLTMRQASGALAAIAALCAMLLTAVPAFAATVTNERPLLFTFDGSGTATGKFSNPAAVEVDQANDLVYVVDQGHNVLDKFNLAGTAQSFSSTGSSSLSPAFSAGLFNAFSDVAVDNSGVNPGRIYVMREFGPVRAFSPAGASLWELTGLSQICGLAVDTTGHPWLGDWTSKVAQQYGATGSPPSKVSSVSVTSGRPCRLDVDASGNLYIHRREAGVDKYVAGVKGPTIDSGSTRAVTVDQSSASGHVFTLRGTNFNEYQADGTLVKTFGNPGSLIGNGLGIAYDQGLDRIYISDSINNAIEVFGPAASGTAPDASTEAASAVGVSKATFNGKANPLSLPDSSYRIEWKEGTAASWATAQSTSATSLPVETAEIPVSQVISGLKGNTTYQTRLATTNDENGLTVYSSPVDFTTATASAPPGISIAPPSSVTTSSAHVTATVDPHEDRTTWSVQKSTDPACASGFTSEPLQTIPSEQAGTVNVEWNLENLLPDEHYCVRITATNSAGTTNSEVKSFTTLTGALAQVFTAFAAPRTDTSARLNGYVNPEGSVVNYHFDYSEDGGSTWIPLPDAEGTSEARRQIVVAQELEGLQPQTTYSYRFTVENLAGSETSQPLTFRTRSTAEMTLPARGDELVNSPDKGTQNVVSGETLMGDSPVSEDGEKALWTVLAGAPGGYNSTNALFLAERTPSRWVSRSVQPPPAEQVGHGELTYFLNARTPDMSRFTMSVVRSEFFGRPLDSTLVRLDDAQSQDVLQQENGNFETRNVDITEDGKHILAVASNGKGQLVDIGSGSPEVVSIMPDGSEAECPLENGRSFSGNAYGGTPSGVASVWHPGYHLINTHDASIVYFQASPNGDCAARQQLYVRDRNTGETTLIDNASAGEVEFMRTTPNGRYGFFATYSQLDSADTNDGRDIYRWDGETEEKTCLTCVVPNANVGPSLISDDFSRIYFQSKRQLIPGKGTENRSSIYLLQNGVLNFVAEAELSSQAGLRDLGVLSTTGADLLFEAKASSSLTADAVGTSTGCHYLVAFDEEKEGEFTGSCEELYRYEADQHSIECVSCAKDATTLYPVGSAIGGGSWKYRMSADGSTIAFATKQALLPTDVNRNTDVYEWRSGAIQLITDGVTAFQEGQAAPQVNAVDRNGENIFFSVVAPGLTGYEHDELLNLYDARIGGGFPRPTPATHCSEESCQGPLQAAPNQSAPSSSSLSGAGNVNVARKTRCRKGQVRRRGRCVRRRSDRRHRTHNRRADHGKRGGSK